MMWTQDRHTVDLLFELLEKRSWATMCITRKRHFALDLQAQMDNVFLSLKVLSFRQS